MFEIEQEESMDEELKYQRRLKAYQDMADLQLKEIIKTMCAYTNTDR